MMAATVTGHSIAVASTATSSSFQQQQPLPIAKKITLPPYQQPNSNNNNNINKSPTNDKFAAQAIAAAKAKVKQSTSMEDVRRMKFLALLCGRGAFNNGASSSGGGGGVPLSSFTRQRSGSLGGMGDEKQKLKSVVGKQAGSIAKGDTSHAQKITTLSSKQTSAVAYSNSGNDMNMQLNNYQPTTPASLSRRILHKSSVGYLDESLPLLLSAMSDRFLATVLAQGMACRNRRLEGYKALLKERKRRKRHRKLVLKERL